MSETTHIVEFVFRVRTNAQQNELDAMMETSTSFEMTAYSLELDNSRSSEDVLWATYLPEGSHWRDVTPVEGGWLASVGEQTVLYIQSPGSHPFHPAAAELPGGNKLSPPQEDLNG